MAGPAPLGPISWAARAQLMGMARQNGAPAPVAAPSPVGDDTDSFFDQAMREEREQDKQDRMRDMMEEAQDRREIRKLERQQRLRRLRASVAGGDDDYASRGRGGPVEDDQITELRVELAAERNDLKGQIAALTGTITAANENSLKAEIGRLSTEISNIRTAAPGVDPMQALTNAFDMASKIRERVDSLMPPPAPPQLDLGLSHEQTLARERAALEHDIYRLERQEALETIQFKREQLRADREKAQERLAGIMSGVRDVAQAFAGAASPMLANLLPAGIGGGQAGGVPQASPFGGIPVATGPPPPMPTGIQFTCPNQACSQVDFVPPGVGVTRCKHCGTGPIFIQDRSLPAPAGMVTSI